MKLLQQKFDKAIPAFGVTLKAGLNFSGRFEKGFACRGTAGDSSFTCVGVGGAAGGALRAFKRHVERIALTRMVGDADFKDASLAIEVVPQDA